MNDKNSEIDSEILNDTCLTLSLDRYTDVSEAPEGSLALVLPTTKLWDSGRTIDINFQNGTDQQKKEFRAAASQWAKYANLVLRFDVASEDSELRIFFGSIGNWSYVGKDNLGISTSSMTMAIQNMSSILHEVGHALGCIHEHSSPSSDIEWNKPVVYKALGGPPNNWPRDKVDHNVFYKYSKDTTQFSKFDPNSIMLYSFPASWTLNGVGTHSNKSLSGTDTSFINRCYPGCTADFSKPEIKTGNCTVKTGPRTLFNKYYGNSWIMNQPNASYIEVSFNQPKQYGGKDIYSKATLKMVHLTSMNGPKAGNSPVDILVNGTVIKKDYSPPSGNYLTDNFDVSQYMKDGQNVVRINFKNASTNYWINKLQVDCEQILY